MAILQLNPTIPVCTPKGDGYAIFLIDYSQEHHLMWVVVLDEPYLTNDPGEIWTFENPQIRVQTNFTIGRIRKPINDNSK